MKRVAITFLFLSACKTVQPQAGPPAADIISVTESKPKPPAAILIDPAANDRYNASVEAWGDRIRAAGMRLCTFYQYINMPHIVCPSK